MQSLNPASSDDGFEMNLLRMIELIYTRMFAVAHFPLSHSHFLSASNVRL